MLLNKQGHYNETMVEVIDIIISYDLDFCLGNTVKYLLRCSKKGRFASDIEKAIDYLDLLIRLDKVPLGFFCGVLPISAVTDDRELHPEVFTALTKLFFSLKYGEPKNRIAMFKEVLEELKCLETCCTQCSL